MAEVSKTKIRCYPGKIAPPDENGIPRHHSEKWYFAPETYASPQPYSPGFDDKAAAALAAAEHAARYRDLEA